MLSGSPDDVPPREASIEGLLFRPSTEELSRSPQLSPRGVRLRFPRRRCRPLGPRHSNSGWVVQVEVVKVPGTPAFPDAAMLSCTLFRGGFIPIFWSWFVVILSCVVLIVVCSRRLHVPFRGHNVPFGSFRLSNFSAGVLVGGCSFLSTSFGTAFATPMTPSKLFTPGITLPD